MTSSPLAETLQVAVFVFAGGVAVQTLALSLVPNWRRIIAALFPVTGGDSSDKAGSRPRAEPTGAPMTAEVR